MTDKTKPLSIRLPITIIEQIEKIAANEDRNISNMIRVMLKRQIEKTE